jgi:hypothetical protein
MEVGTLARSIALPLLAVAFLTQAASPQAAPGAKRTANPTGNTTLPAGIVTERSPVINAKEIGRTVAPGVLEINPASILNKRLLLTPGDPTARVVCIGFWRKDRSCAGIYIENSKG